MDTEGWLRLAATPGLDDEGLAWVLERFATGDELLRQSRRAGTPLAHLGAAMDQSRVDEALTWLDQGHRQLVHRLHPACLKQAPGLLDLTLCALT